MFQQLSPSIACSSETMKLFPLPRSRGGTRSLINLPYRDSSFKIPHLVIPILPSPYCHPHLVIPILSSPSCIPWSSRFFLAASLGPLLVFNGLCLAPPLYLAPTIAHLVHIFDISHHLLYPCLPNLTAHRHPPYH